MSHFAAKQEVSVAIDARLLAEIDQMASDRSAVFEEALRLWRTQKVEEQLRRFYQSQGRSDIEFEEEWAEDAQKHLEEILETEGL